MFDFPRGRLNQARKILNLQYPVSVRIMSGKRQVGSHKFSSKEKRHRITVSSAQSLVEINRTLWHELQHAKDFEKWESLCAINPSNPISYRRVITEESAREAEEKYLHHWLVTPSGKQIKAIHF
jgi:hypothetical protein